MGLNIHYECTISQCNSFLEVQWLFVYSKYKKIEYIYTWEGNRNSQQQVKFTLYHPHVQAYFLKTNCPPCDQNTGLTSSKSTFVSRPWPKTRHRKDRRIRRRRRVYRIHNKTARIRARRLCACCPLLQRPVLRRGNSTNIRLAHFRWSSPTVR